jgi:hypothetical protein
MSKQLLSPFHTGALELEKCPNHFKKAAKDVTVEAVEDGNSMQMIMKPAAAACGVADDAAVEGSAAFGESASEHIVHVVKINKEGALGAEMDAMDKEYKGVEMWSEAVDAKAADTGTSTESIVAMANNDRDVGMVNSSMILMEDVEEPEVIKVLVSVGHGAEGAKEAADDVMVVVEEAVEQIEQLMTEDGSIVGLEDQMAKMGRPNSKIFEPLAHHKRKSNHVHRLSRLVLLLAVSDCEATMLPGYSVHSSLRMGSHSHTAAEPWAALQFGNHSIGQYACQGALRPTFIVGLPSCFVFGCGLFLLLRELEKAQNPRFVSKGCKRWYWSGLLLFSLCSLSFSWDLQLRVSKLTKTLVLMKISTLLPSL